MKKIIIAVLVLGLMCTAGVGMAATVKAPVIKDIGATKIKKVAEEFVSKYLVDGAKVEVTVGTKNSGLYDLSIKIDGAKAINSRMSIDGADFYPSVINVADFMKKNSPANSAKPSAAVTAPVSSGVTKSFKPTVDLFVMSYCPYGTQALKGIIPAVEALGKKIDFKMKFVNYIMHGQKETMENLNQYCINLNQSDKFLPYMKCFLASSDSAACLASNNIDKTRLATCVTETDAKFAISAGAKASGNYPAFNIHKDDNVKYGVQGSPTLIINGKESNAGRDSASYLAAMCAAFVTPPAECKTQLSAVSPAPGFGTATTQTAVAADCAQ